MPDRPLQRRLGEGTGAVVAMHLVEAAIRLDNEMAAFEPAGGSDRSAPSLRYRWLLAHVARRSASLGMS